MSLFIPTAPFLTVRHPENGSWMGERRAVSFFYLSSCQTVQGWVERVLRKGAGQQSMGSRGIQRDVKCPEREVRGNQSTQGLFPESVRPALSLGLWRRLQNNKHWEVILTLVSRTGHLIERASDKGQVVFPRWRKKNAPAQQNSASLDARLSPLSCLSQVTACLLKMGGRNGQTQVLSALAAQPLLQIQVLPGWHWLVTTRMKI